MFSKNLIDEIYKAIKESDLSGTVYVDPETMEVTKFRNDIRVFFNDVESEESRNKARIELALFDFYRR